VGRLPGRSELIISTVIVALTVLGLAVVARLFWLAAEIFLLILIAAILATGLSPLVERLHARQWTPRRVTISRGLSIALVHLGLLFVLYVIGNLFVVPIVAETAEFVQKAPALYEQFLEMLRVWQQRYAWVPDLGALIDRLPQEAGRLTQYVGAATGVAFRVFGGIVSAVTVLILSVYMLFEGPVMRRGFLELFAQRHRRRAEAVLDGIALKFGGWLRGQLFLGLIIGVAVGIGTWILGLPYPFLLGLAAGVTELIPIVGPVLGAIPAVLVAVFGPWWKVPAVIALFTVVQQAENHLLVPRVMKMSVGLSPLLTIIAIMIGAKLMGILGALLAVPVAAALQVIVGEVLRLLRPAA
jgi:predicted PurR-regulated permease PerM